MPADKKVMDVAHPGKSPASSTAKPVIVSNRPVMKDTTVTESSEEAATAPILTPAKKVVIQPLHPDMKTEEKPEQEAEKPVETVAPAEESQAPEATPDPVPVEKPAEPEPAAETPAEEPAPKEDDPQLTEEKAQETALEEAKHEAELQEMVDDERYFLPIDSVHRRSRRVVVWGLLVAVVLLAAWYDIALDAGLVPNTSNVPHTSWFSVK